MSLTEQEKNLTADLRSRAIDSLEKAIALLKCSYTQQACEQIDTAKSFAFASRRIAFPAPFSSNSETN